MRLRIPSPGGICKNCAAPMDMVDESYDDEDAIRQGMEDVLDGFSRLLAVNDVADSGAST